MDGGGRLQPHRLADLPHGGRIALTLYRLGNIVVDPLLHFRHLRHSHAPFPQFYKESITHHTGNCNICSRKISIKFAPRRRRHIPRRRAYTPIGDNMKRLLPALLLLLLLPACTRADAPAASASADPPKYVALTFDDGPSPAARRSCWTVSATWARRPPFSWWAVRR